MARGDYYASAFGTVFSAYMERPWLSRLIARVVWGSDVRPYYESMGAIADVPPGGTIVDCPCGAGPALRMLDPAAPGRYLAADLSPAMLRRARMRAAARNLNRVEVVRADATELPLPPASADLYLSLWGLHCFDDPQQAVAEAARVLKPGGRLVGATFVLGDSGLRPRLLLRPGRGDLGPMGSEADVLAWLEGNGFELSRRQRSGAMLFFDAQRAGVPAA
jgi:SAM-dependent methyltransferase